VWQGTMSMAFDSAAHSPTGATPNPTAAREALEAGMSATPEAEPGIEVDFSDTAATSEPQLSPERWVANFKQRLLSETVMQSTLNNLNANLSVQLFSTPSALTDHLAAELQITGTPDNVHFTYSTTDREHADDLLQNLGHAIVGDQMSSGGDDRTARILQDAQRSAQPLRDDTNLYMAAIFLGQLAVGLLLTVVLRFHFARATPVLHSGAGGASMAVLAKPLG